MKVECPRMGYKPIVLVEEYGPGNQTKDQEDVPWDASWAV